MEWLPGKSTLKGLPPSPVLRRCWNSPLAFAIAGRRHVKQQGMKMMAVLGPLISCLLFHVHYNPVQSKDLDFGFGFLPVRSEMGEIREFRCFSVI
jgi:hypothetical protein